MVLSFCLLCAAAPAPPGDPGQFAYSQARFEAAHAIWQARAEAGDAAAQFGLGLLYDLGQGVLSDSTRAYAWYLRAAEQGLPQAEFNVGVLCDGGRGTAHDARAAALWYARAAAHGLRRAAYNLAQLYEAGEGVPKNPDEAAAWYSDAAAELPAAADRLHALSLTTRKAIDPDAVLAAPVPLRSPGTAPPQELVWWAPAQPAPVSYLVTVMALDGAAPRTIFEGPAAKSALLVPALAGIHSFAWRVFAVGTQGAHYAASKWQVEGHPG